MTRNIAIDFLLMKNNTGMAENHRLQPIWTNEIEMISETI